MATETLYNYDPITPAQITRELYSNVGSSSFQLGDASRGFKGGSDFEMWDSPTGGTQLVENTDYELLDIDNRLSPNAGFDIYTRVRVLNATYQTGNVYFTYKVVQSYVDAAFYNALYVSANTPVSLSLKYLTSADSPFTILDGDGFTHFICDTSGGDIDIVFPTLADNQDREFTVVHQVGGGVVNVDGEGAETIASLTDFDLPEQGNRASFLGTTTEWAITDERITAQFRLTLKAGFGSTDNKIIRFTNKIEDTNNGKFYNENHTSGYNSNTEGIEMEILKEGWWSLLSAQQASGGIGIFGISLNSPQLTTAITAINVDDKLNEQACTSTGGLDYESGSATVYLVKNDILRIHSNGTNLLNGSDDSYLILTYLGA